MHQRQQPADRPEAQRQSCDAVQVDLVAGEEEQHAQPEAGEEDHEVAHVQPEHLRADHHPQEQLGDDGRDEQSASGEHGCQRARERGGGDDSEERRGLGLDIRKQHLSKPHSDAIRPHHPARMIRGRSWAPGTEYAASSGVVPGTRQ